MASNLGKIFVELELDDRVYKQRLSEVQGNAVATAKGVETAWKALGSSSEAVFNAKKTAAQNAYRLIRESALSTTQDITRAHEAMNHKIQQLNQQQVGVHQATNKSLTDQAASWGLIASKAYIAYQAVHAITGVFTAGFKAVEDYRVSVASLASTIATFSQQGKTDMAGAYREAHKYASLLVEKVEEWDAKTVLTGKQLTAMVETLAQGGVMVDVNNKKQEEGIIAIANAIAMVTKGQNVDIQMRQEIRGLIDGEAKATNRLATILEQAVGGSLKDHIEKWKEEGTLIENAGKLLSGFGEGAKDLEKTWGAISTSMETAANKILRDAFKPIYEDIVRLAREYTLEVLKGGAGLDAAKDKLENGIYKTWTSIKNIVDSIYRVVGPLIEAEKVVLGLAEKILDQLGNVVAIFTVLAKRIGLVFQGELRAAFSTGITNELRAGLAVYTREIEKAAADWDAAFSGGGKAAKPPKLAPVIKNSESIKEAQAAMKQAQSDAEAMRRALEELNVMVGKTESEMAGKLAAIEKRYADMREKLKGNSEALVTLEQWKKDAIAKLYAEQDKDTTKFFEDATRNYNAGFKSMAHEIEEGVKLTQAHLNKMGVKSESGEWAQNADDAIKEMERFVTVGQELGDQWRNQEAQANDTFFGGLKAGFDETIEHQRTTAQLGKDIWRDFTQELNRFVGQQVDQFIWAEDTKKSILQASGESMANLAGEISKKMYAAAIEKIISIIGALIGEAAGGSAAAGALKGGVTGALLEMGIFLGAGVAAMLGGKAMAQSFKAEGGWVASHPMGGWIREGSGYQDDVFLGMTPGTRHWGMGGEFVVNKDSAAKHAGLLHAINSKHADGGPLNDSWEPLADMLVIGTLASAGFGFAKGGPWGALAEAITFNVAAIGGAFGGKILADAFKASGGEIKNEGHGFIGDWINPFNNPITRAIGLPSPRDWLPDWLPEPGEAAAFLFDPGEVLELIKEVIREPYKQIAKDLITPGINWSSPIEGVTSGLHLLETVFKKMAGIKHAGGVIGEDERMIIAQTGEGIVSRAGMNNLGRLNMGHAGGGYVGPGNNSPTGWTPAILPDDATDEQQALLNIEKTRHDMEITYLNTAGYKSMALAQQRANELAVMDESLRRLQSMIYLREDEAANEALWIEYFRVAGNEAYAVSLERNNELRSLNETQQIIKKKIWAQEDLNAANEKAAQLATDRRSLEIELMSALGNASGALAAQRADELKAMDPSLRGIKRQIYAAQDAATAQEELTRVQTEAASKLEAALGKLKAEDFATSYDFRKAVGLTKIRGYDSGGYHPGGWRMVGESGPEIEWTGPSRIFSNGGSGDPLGNGALVSEVRALRQELNQLGTQTVFNTGKTARILDRFDGDGMPETRDSDAITWG